MKNVSKALLEAQKLIDNAKKDAKNPHFKNNYATLESVLSSVKNAANQSGLAVVQSCGKDVEGHFLETSVIHGDSGEMVSSRIYLVLDKQNMQGLGSALTYARRYSLAGLFAIGQEDDDGNAASGNPVKQSGIATHFANAVKMPEIQDSINNTEYEKFFNQPKPKGAASGKSEL